MQEPFEGTLSFYHIDEALLPATAVLEKCRWKIDEYNGPHLAGKAPPPSRGFVKLTEAQAFGGEPRALLPETWTEADRLLVVGDIDHDLGASVDVIVACTTNFKTAEEMAKKLGYRPAKAGEYLQLLYWLHENPSVDKCAGWFFCYEGRKQQYAVLADFVCGQPLALREIIFDTYIGNGFDDGYVSANRSTYCFFVRTN